MNEDRWCTWRDCAVALILYKEAGLSRLLAAGHNHTSHRAQQPERENQRKNNVERKFQINRLRGGPQPFSVMKCVHLKRV